MLWGGATVLRRSNGTTLLVAGGGGGASFDYNGLADKIPYNDSYILQYPPEGKGGGGGGQSVGRDGRGYVWVRNLRYVLPDSEIRNPDGTYKYFRPETIESPYFTPYGLDLGDIRNYDTSALNSIGMVGEYCNVIQGDEIADWYSSSPGFTCYYQLWSNTFESELSSGWLYSDYYNNASRFSATIDFGIVGASKQSDYYFDTLLTAQESYNIAEKIQDCRYTKKCLDESWFEVRYIDKDGNEQVHSHVTPRDIMQGEYEVIYTDGQYPHIEWSGVGDFSAYSGFFCNASDWQNTHDTLVDHLVPHNSPDYAADAQEHTICYLSGDFIVHVDSQLPDGVKAVRLVVHCISYTNKPGEGVARGVNNGYNITGLQLLTDGYGAEAGTSYKDDAVTDFVETVGENNTNGYARITQLSTHTHNYTSEATTQPTCTVKGIRTYTCTGTATDAGCGDTYTEDIDALGHNEDTGTVTTQPTCTEKGIKTFKCTRCSTVLRTEDIDALGHIKASDWSYESNNSIENGRGYKNCTRCGVCLEQKFKLITDGSYGTKDVTSGCSYYYEGDSVSVSSGSITGYRFVSWSGDLISSDNPFTFSMPAKAIKLKAEALPNEAYLEYIGGLAFLK